MENPSISPSCAKRLVEISPALEKQLEKRAELVLKYAESLVKKGEPNSADLCLNALASKEFLLPSLTSLTGQSIRRRLLADRIMASEERYDLTSARALMKEFVAAPGKTSSEDLRISEVDARLSLLSGDYELAESKSRALEAALDATISSSAVLQISPRDNFVNEHREAILDRVQALNHTGKYAQAARLVRLVLLMPYSNTLFSRTGAACAANLAFAYANSGHKGMGEVFEQEAAFKDLSSLPLAPSRYMVDAKEKLAVLSEARGNLPRARRYRAEAQAMRSQLQTPAHTQTQTQTQLQTQKRPSPK